jgi:VWFA-related protein
MAKYLRVLEWCREVPKFALMVSLSHRQGWSFMLALAIFPSLLFGSGGGDDETLRYRTGSSEVRLSFFATDQNGRPLEPLTKDDFAVVDSGLVIRDFRSLTRSAETALDIVALVDTSESVAPRFGGNMQNFLQLVHTQSTSRNQTLSVIQFSGLQPSVLCSGDCSSAAMQSKVAQWKAQGPTPLFDALTSTARFISSRRRPDVRQVVILFSDGNDTISRASAREAFDALLATGALLYAVNVDRSAAGSEGSLVLQQMAEATGGRSFASGENTATVLQTILADLHACYVVTYPLPNRQAGFHSIRILPKRNLKLQFHSRRGYYYDEDR